MMVRNHNKCRDDIWLNPKCFCNGNLVAKPRNRKVKRLSREGVHYKQLVVEMGGS